MAIQVLTQSRPHIIEKTMDAVRGAREVVIHLYNSTSTLQREVVFGFDRKECIDLAVSGAKMIREYIDGDKSDTRSICEYSPESFSLPSLNSLLQSAMRSLTAGSLQLTTKLSSICPETVEYQTPNVYADQVEYFCRNTKWRNQIIVSLHTPAKPRTAVASSNSGIMAGADKCDLLVSARKL